jgi:ubiquinone/menaquinone biosynthesis C-methylase UbiE
VTRSSRGYFDAIGSDWDRLQRAFYSDRVREKALTHARVQGGRRAADLGAGTGFITQGLIERGIRVIAVDPSPAMLEVVRRKFPWPKRVDCRTGEAEKLPIANASVDYCFANMCLHHVDDPRVAIAEMARILRPGGRAVVTDLDAHELACLSEEHHDRWKGFDREDIRRWFREAGLAEVRVDGLGEDCCPTGADGKGAAVSIFIASGTRPAAG